MSTFISKLFQSSRPYIKPEYECNVLSWKYQSQQDSLWYEYIQRPMCDEIVKYLPLWLAPNLITLTSFAFIVLPHLLLVALYGNETEGPCPSWFCVL